MGKEEDKEEEDKTKEAAAAKEAATDRQQPVTTSALSPPPNDALEGSKSEASTSRRSWHPPFRLWYQGMRGCYTTGVQMHR